MATNNNSTAASNNQIPKTDAGKTALWVDDRLGVARFARTMLNKIFPDHWSFMLGEIALYAFVILILTGIYLTLFFSPGTAQVIYHGSYAPLRGIKMSQAYASTIHLSFGVKGGLLMRQMHHWAAIIFIAAIIVHMARVFFTGAFRKPRELNWIVGVTLMILAVVNGFAGYSLPDDLMSGTGIRIAYSIVLSIPVIGTWLAYIIFGGNYPAAAFLPRLYVIHILIIPGIIAGLLVAHLGIMIRQKHTQFPGPGKTEKNVVGSPLWPTYAAKSTGFFFLTLAVIALLGGLFEINPIWIYGPYEAWKVSAATQPDWYIGWLDGALRLMPNWEIRAFGYTVANPFFAGVLLPGLTFGMLYAWPFIEEKYITKDHEYHQLLDKPRDNPLRTGIGAGTLAAYSVMLLAGANDVIANWLHVSLNGLLMTLRALLFIMPIIVGFAAYYISKELAKTGSGKPTSRPSLLIRDEKGGYTEIETEQRPEDFELVEEPVQLPDEITYGHHPGADAHPHSEAILGSSSEKISDK